MIDLWRKGRPGQSECAKGSIELFYGFFTDFDEYTLEAIKTMTLWTRKKGRSLQDYARESGAQACCPRT